MTTRMRRTSSLCSIRPNPVQYGGRSSIAEIPKSECPDIWIRQPRQKWPKSWSNIEEAVVLLDLNLFICLLKYCGKDNEEKFYWDLDWKKYQGIRLEAKHVKAHGSKKEKQEVTIFAVQ